MLCPNCQATVEEGDRFCPKCGGGLTVMTARTQAAAGTPVSPQVVEARTSQGARVGKQRVPIAEGGRKYAGLVTAAQLMIKTASVIRIISYIISALTFIYILIFVRQLSWLRYPAVFGFLGGLIVGSFIALMGWWQWLVLTVSGELMYIIIDIEENLRRRL